MEAYEIILLCVSVLLSVYCLSSPIVRLLRLMRSPCCLSFIFPPPPKILLSSWYNLISISIFPKIQFGRRHIPSFPSPASAHVCFPPPRSVTWPVRLCVPCLKGLWKPSIESLQYDRPWIPSGCNVWWALICIHCVRKCQTSDRQ
jgi:hypothetical protein